MTRAADPLEDPVAAAYLDWCVRENVPANTVRRRRTVLRAVGNPGNATREDLEHWWETRTHLPDGQRRKDSTRANDLAVLRAFYKWAQIWEYRETDPTIRIRPPASGRGAPRPATRREFEQILTHLEDLQKHGPALRRAVLLGAWAGLRVSEAATLSWPDIDGDTRRARVTGKGRKTRYVKFSAALLKQLGERHDGNVVTGRATGWAGTTLGHRVNAEIRAAGVNVTFHKLRHRYGSVAYQATKDPKALAEQMGHASVSTTLTFYAAAADDAADAIADAVVHE